jgi:hypothetical protein
VFQNCRHSNLVHVHMTQGQIPLVNIALLCQHNVLPPLQGEEDEPLNRRTLHLTYSPLVNMTVLCLQHLLGYACRTKRRSR